MRRQLAELKEYNKWLCDTLSQAQLDNRQLEMKVQMYADSADGYRRMAMKSSEHFDRALGIMRDLSVKQA